MMVRELVELMCREVVELVTEYLSGTMPPEDRVRLEQHLLTCPPCTAYLQQVRTTVALTRGLAEAPAGAADDPAMAAFRRWKSGP
jgi:anti-sigma factor RsiW